jgi:hypothetical protein
MFVMTGDTSHIKEKESDGVMKANKKRKCLGYGKPMVGKAKRAKM